MCTTVIVGRLASTTGRVILGHNEDSGGRHASAVLGARRFALGSGRSPTR